MTTSFVVVVVPLFCVRLFFPRFPRRQNKSARIIPIIQRAIKPKMIQLRVEKPKRNFDQRLTFFKTIERKERCENLHLQLKNFFLDR